MTPGSTSGAGAPPSLRRSLGRWDLIAIGVNQVIGGAVFLIPAQIVLHVGGWRPRPPRCSSS